ncbi:MAG: DUF4190 domain-containing protein [Limisphaerales bacterium]
MSDSIKFACPSCGQSMTADDRWVGQQIQCPTCKNNFTVPTGTRLQGETVAPPIVAASRRASPNQTAPVRMSGLAILSFCLALMTFPLNALSRVAHLPIGLLGCIPAVICGHIALTQIRTRSNVRGRGFAIAGLVIGYLAIIVGLIALAFLLVRGVSHQTATVRSNSASVQAQPTEPSVTTDPNTAEIPSTPVSGTVGNLSFTVQQAEVSSGVLSLRDQPKNPNVEVIIFLFLKGGESLSGTKRIVPGESAPPHIHLRWKEGSALKSKTASRGYAMRLEFGQQKGGLIPGKVYLEMPESYGTKFAGTFEARVK